jgi:NitT/TauT family transport system permease protein
MMRAGTLPAKPVAARGPARGGPAWLAGAGGIAAFLLVWQVVAISGLMPASLLPAPTAIPAAFGREIAGGFWLLAVGQSLHHYLIGVVIGSALGVAAGVAVGESAAIEAWQAGLARLLRPIPPLAWVPFALIWFGVSETAAAFIIAISVFWVNYFATLAAVKQVDPGLRELGRAFGHGGLIARLGKIVLPAASPGIFGGLRAGFGQGWMVVVASELFGIPGIGQRMMEASGMLATDIVVVYMLTIALLYGLSDWLFQSLVKRSLSWMA